MRVPRPIVIAAVEDVRRRGVVLDERAVAELRERIVESALMFVGGDREQARDRLRRGLTDEPLLAKVAVQKLPSSM